MSFNLTTPVRNDRERSGMPDLKSTVELGPSFDIHLFRSDDAKFKLDLRMPLRAAVTVQGSPQFIGWTFTPRLNLDIADPLGFNGLESRIFDGTAVRRSPLQRNISIRLHRNTRPLSRPDYEASGGYAGTQSIAALSKRYPKFWVGAYMRYDTLAGAVFVDSPLVQRRSYWSAGFGFAWMLRRSSSMVEVPD